MSGKADILSVSVVGFLAFSLVAVISVTVNPNIRQVFAPKAIDPSYFTTSNPSFNPATFTNGYDKDTVINLKANDKDQVGYDCNNGGCPAGVEVVGYYVSNGKFYPIAGSNNDPGKYADTSQATKKAKDAEEEKQQTAATPVSSWGYTREEVVNTVSEVNRTGYDCSKGGCATGVDVSGYYLHNGKYYPIEGTGNNPSKYVETSLATVNAKKEEAQEARQKALAQKVAEVQEKTAQIDSQKIGNVTFVEKVAEIQNKIAQTDTQKLLIDNIIKTSAAASALSAAAVASLPIAVSNLITPSIPTQSSTPPPIIISLLDNYNSSQNAAGPEAKVSDDTKTQEDLTKALKDNKTNSFYLQTDKQWKDYVISTVDIIRDDNGNVIEIKKGKKTMEQIGCGPATVANILKENGITKIKDPNNKGVMLEVTPVNIAKVITANSFGSSGTSWRANVDLLKENGFTYDKYTNSLLNITKYTKPTDTIWLTALVNNDILHHTYINGYTVQNGKAVFTMKDPYFSDGTESKCTVSGNTTLSCTNSKGTYSYNTINTKEADPNKRELAVLIINGK